MILFICISITILDVAFKLATILIAVLNVILTIYVFHRNTKRTNSQKEEDRKMVWFKTLILDQNLTHLYDFFELLEEDLTRLNLNALNIEEKQKVIESTDDLFINLRRKFIDPLLGIDKNLYEKILEKLDLLQEKISIAVFDEGLNLNHLPMFKEKMLTPVSNTKTSVIKSLFNYRGD